MQIVEITSADDIVETYPIIRQLYTELTEEKYREYVTELLGLGYRRVIAKVGDTCVASAGFLMGVHFRFGKYIYVNDLVTDEDKRSCGAGKALLDWIAAEGKAQHCTTITLACNVDRHRSHRFYFREGYRIHGYYFMKQL